MPVLGRINSEGDVVMRTKGVVAEECEKGDGGEYDTLENLAEGSGGMPRDRKTLTQQIARELQLKQGCRRLLNAIPRSKETTAQRNEVKNELKSLQEGVRRLQAELQLMNGGGDAGGGAAGDGFAVLPLCETGHADLFGALSRCMSTHYLEPEGSEVYEPALLAIEAARQAAARGNAQPLLHKRALVVYYHHLAAAEPRFFDGDRCAGLQFQWHDAFSGAMVSTPSLKVERAGVLWNAAAACTAIAARADRGSEVGLREARAELEEAAGLLLHIQTKLMSKKTQELGLFHLRSKSLSAAISLVLAQAQECSYELHVLRGRGAVAAADEGGEDFLPDAGEAAAVAGHYHSTAAALAQLSKVLPDGWLEAARSKRHLFGGLAYQYAALGDLMSFTSAAKQDGLKRMQRAATLLQQVRGLPAAEQAVHVAARVLDRISDDMRRVLDAMPDPVPPTAVHGDVKPRHGFLKRQAGHDLFEQMGPVSFFNMACTLADRKAMTLRVSAASGRFGFAVSGAQPVRIASVQPGSVADMAGLCVGDHILELAGSNARHMGAREVEDIVIGSIADGSLDITTIRNVDIKNYEELIDCPQPAQATPVTGECTLPIKWNGSALTGRRSHVVT